MTSPDSRVQRISSEADPWRRQREIARAVRHDFTDVLKFHGAKGKDYAVCTNTMYVEALGKSAQRLRVERGLGPKTNLRNFMTVSELAVISFGEVLAGERIVEERCDGGEECRLATAQSARSLRACIETERRGRKSKQPVAANDQAKAEKAA
ncbi:hypothetical protein [Brevundimonas sp. UBA7534]|uniref:hypothetical protein n=1 Tax=Brevundimonas sp. UBA7534 TaxID=1946138 RepID=UPI0025C1B862|nr:hypothetical protein [Brevundimonas sp. UBA7534]